MYSSKIGQLAGPFAYKNSLYTQLWNTYYIDVEDEYEQILVSINSLSLDVDPGAVFYIQSSSSSDVNRYVTGETGVLDFYDENSIIEEAYFAGKHFDIATAEEAERETLPETKYVESGIELSTGYSINDLKLNYVYILDGVRCIWYNQGMYVIDDNGDIQCPVDGLVNYTCDIAKGYYYA